MSARSMRARRLGPVAAGLAVLALGVGVATAAARSHEAYTVSATLAAKNEVPRPTGVPARARGAFTGTLTTGAKATLRWKLTFSGLSGAATQAHVHMGRPGTSGNVVIPLCGPCRSGASGTARITSSVADAIESGKSYVNVHTAKNGAGEIRGQIAARG